MVRSRTVSPGLSSHFDSHWLQTLLTVDVCLPRVRGAVVCPVGLWCPEYFLGGE